MKTLLIILSGTLIFLGVITVILWNERQSVAYVRTQELVEGYKGAKITHEILQNKRNAIQANIDTLSREFDENVSRFNSEESTLTETEKAKKEQLLNIQRGDISRYAKAMEKQAGEEEIKLFEGMLNQINSGVRQYAIEHNIDLVVGTSSSGTVMYGSEDFDITNDVLKWLNANN